MKVKIATICSTSIMYLLSLTLPAKAVNGFNEGFASLGNDTANHQNIKSADVPQQTLTAETVTPLAIQDTTQTDSLIAQVTQVNDVQNTDWAYEALKGLVNRYGCIDPDPNGSFGDGTRGLTRYQFAALLSSCIDRINELASTAPADLISKSDIETLKKFQEDFSAELAIIRPPVEN
ncbi:iron uptake porin [Anabaena lutea]|uniref:Iron uptake porin n=1 Tax=Anabaena lutea FACHB-196 TaxID=2692881 RepID=A0ABR8FCL1_9NOST|nr:iron uptake porin [Anabaena lutea]MBD2567509.1 iron uptake porin [Anabaena lutea FACHB-196]